MNKRTTIPKGDLEIGQRIRVIRKNKNLTQRRLAELVMISPSSITRLENGQVMVSVFTMIELVRVLDVSISEMLFGDSLDMVTETDLLEIAIKLKKCSLEEQKKLIKLFAELIDVFLLR